MINVPKQLDRLPWSNEAQLHPARVGPHDERTSAEFGPVVHQQRARQVVCLSKSAQDADHAQSG